MNKFHITKSQMSQILINTHRENRTRKIGAVYTSDGGSNTPTLTHIVHLIHQYFAIGALASDVGITKCSITMKLMCKRVTKAMKTMKPCEPRIYLYSVYVCI